MLMRDIRKINSHFKVCCYPDDVPHIQSRAAYVLLVKSLVKQDKTKYNAQRYLRKRKHFLQIIQSLNHNKLWCEYCGKPVYNFENTAKTKKVTIDHYEPVSSGHDAYDENNYVIACYQCNRNFGNTPSKNKVIKFPMIRIKQVASPEIKYKNKFNKELYQRIRSVRDTINNNEILVDHPLTGKKLRKIIDGAVYTIESVHKMWDEGYFICLLIVKNKSHSQLYWENINSDSKDVIKYIEEHRPQYVIAN